MNEPTERLDDDTDTPHISYSDMVVAHMLHRIWELQIAQCLLAAETEEDREFINEIVANQQRGEYMQEFTW